MNSNIIKKIYKTIMLILVVGMVTVVITSMFLYNKFGISKYSDFNINGVSSELIKKINAVKTILDNEYMGEMEESKLIESAVKGYVSGVDDEYTEYFTKEEMEEFMIETEGSYVGIGVYIARNTETNDIVIVATIKESPAEKAGLLSGDVIRKINDIEYTGDDFENVSSYIKGKEGTKVKLEIERNEEKLCFEIERKEIKLYPIETKKLENDIGYINIESFDIGVGEDFKKAFNKLNKEKLNGLVIDLRNNGGGVLDEALEIADYILEKNDIILIIKDKDGNEKIEKSSNKPIINLPIVVLTNEYSASASEILAASLKDNNKAKLVGEKTYGKGLIQELITLSDGSGLKITTEKYYTPNQKEINKIGIEPDVQISLPEDVSIYSELDYDEDTQLKEAVKILSGK